jgi:hypothetical protein
MTGLDKVEKIIRDIYLGLLPTPSHLKLKPDMKKYYEEWVAPKRIKPTKAPVTRNVKTTNSTTSTRHHTKSKTPAKVKIPDDFDWIL